MKDIVTFQMAKKLKDAGFPQPQRVEEETWFYHESGTLFCAQHVIFSPAGHPEIFYAPSVEDAEVWLEENKK